jgi:hypothetical protein
MRPGRLGRPWRALAAAAIIEAAAGLGLSCSPEAAPQAGAAVRSRESGLQLISPAGEASGPIEFRWQPSAAALAYRLHFIDGREREIYTADVKETRHTLPASVLDQMEDPVTYFWRVDALDADGRVIETTNMVSFLWTR